MSENKENKLTLINEKTANDYLTHTKANSCFISVSFSDILKEILGDKGEMFCYEI